MAVRDNIDDWETFTLIELWNTSNVALISHANNHLVCAEAGGSQPLIANRVQLGPWEKFSL